MATLVDAASTIADASRFLLAETVNGVTFLMVRNYELVSFLLGFLIQCLHGIRYLAIGVCVAASDFIDQYGEFCVTVTESVLAGVQFAIECFLLVGRLSFDCLAVIFDGLIRLIGCVLLVGRLLFSCLAVIFDGLIWLIECPIRIWNVISIGAAMMIKALQSTPLLILDLIIDGFSFLGWLALNAAIAPFWIVGRAVVLIFGAAMAIIDGISILGWLALNAAVAPFWIVGRTVVLIFGAAMAILTKRAISMEVLEDEEIIPPFGVRPSFDRRFVVRVVEIAIGLFVFTQAYRALVGSPNRLRLIRHKAFRTCRTIGSRLRNFDSRISAFLFGLRAMTFVSYRLVLNYFRSLSSTGTTRNGENGIREQEPASLRRLALNFRSSDRAVNTTPSVSKKKSITSSTGTNPGSERYLCVVCQDKEKSVMVEYCNHVCMCRECAESVLRQQRRCPICRSLIISLTDVYL